MTQLLTHPESIVMQRIVRELMPSEQDKERIHDLVMFLAKSAHIKSEAEYKIMAQNLEGLQVSIDKVLDIIKDYIDPRHIKECLERDEYYFKSLYETIENSSIDDEKKIIYKQEVAEEHNKNTNSKFKEHRKNILTYTVCALSIIGTVGKVLIELTEDPSVKKARIKRQSKHKK